jgi:hypothetical protein
LDKSSFEAEVLPRAFRSFSTASILLTCEDICSKFSEASDLPGPMNLLGTELQFLDAGLESR